MMIPDVVKRLRLIGTERATALEAAVEIERLRAALVDAGRYAALCPPPPEAVGILRIDLLETRERLISVARVSCLVTE